MIVNRARTDERDPGGRSGIEVSETDDAYLVKIHPNDKERAKRIVGRRWDWKLKRWVYPKTVGSFDALRAEFGQDAILFEISEPLPALDQRPVAQLADDPAVEDWREPTATDPREVEGFTELAASLASVLAAIRGVERSTSQIRTLIEDEYAKPTGSEDEASDDAVEHSVLEAGLKSLAFSAAGDDPSFREWLSGVNPILDPFQFVSRTHEILRASLLEYGGDKADSRIPFGKVVSDLRERELLPRRPFNVPQALFAMNDHRNWFAHPTDARESEATVRSLIYLLNLGLIWQLVSAPVDELDDPQA